MKRRTFASTLFLLALSACGGEPPAPSEAAASNEPAPRRIPVTVDHAGYHPARVEAPAGQLVTLVFTRTSDQGCGQQLVFPDLGIRRDLPLGVEVPVTVRPTRGEVRFTCGMDMYRGLLVGQ